MSVTLTPKAATRVRDFLAARSQVQGLRFGIKTTGCSGFAYTVGYAEQREPDDHVFESHGIKIFVDPKSLDFVQGTEIDFRRDGLNESFHFNNPNVKDTCGCGESFSV